MPLEPLHLPTLLLVTAVMIGFSGLVLLLLMQHSSPSLDYSTPKSPTMQGSLLWSLGILLWKLRMSTWLRSLGQRRG